MNSPFLLDIWKLVVIDSSIHVDEFKPIAVGEVLGNKSRHSAVVKKAVTMPDQTVILSAKQADCTQMEALVDVDTEAIHLFDHGYTDYRQYNQLYIQWTRLYYATEQEHQNRDAQ